MWFQFSKNGSCMWKSNDFKMIRFACYRFRKFRGNTRSMNNFEYNFCCQDFENDKKNSLGEDGIHCQQKIWTKRAINSKYTYPLYFYMAHNRKGFFVVPDLGVKKNFYHNQQLNTKISLQYGKFKTKMRNLLQVWIDVYYLQLKYKLQYFKAVETSCLYPQSISLPNISEA